MKTSTHQEGKRSILREKAHEQKAIMSKICSMRAGRQRRLKESEGGGDRTSGSREGKISILYLTDW